MHRPAAEAGTVAAIGMAAAGAAAAGRPEDARIGGRVDDLLRGEGLRRPVRGLGALGHIGTVPI